LWDFSINISDYLGKLSQKEVMMKSIKTSNIFTNMPDSLPSGKADFLLALSDAKGSSISACLDAEYLINEKLYSAEHFIQEPSPVVVTRAIHNLHPFASLEILNLGMERLPQHSTCALSVSEEMPLGCQNFNISPSEKLDARAIFTKGADAGRRYELKGNYLILAQSTNTPNTEIEAMLLALGYACNKGASKANHSNLDSLSEEMSSFEKLSLLGERTLLFYAGFILEASRRFHVVLAGGFEMAACLLVADKLREYIFMRVKSDNITLATTRWALEDKNSDIRAYLSELSYIPHAIFTDFSFKSSEITTLHQYDKGKVQESAGVGAALAYASQNQLSTQSVIEQIEYLIYTM